jgi:hypothetical protein
VLGYVILRKDASDDPKDGYMLSLTRYGTREPIPSFLPSFAAALGVKCIGSLEQPASRHVIDPSGGELSYVDTMKEKE